MPLSFLAENGKAAIWRNQTGFAPFNTPLSHLGDVVWHSGLNYLPWLPARKITTSVAVPATTSTLGRIINLGAHGQGGVPFVEGFVTVSGVIRPLKGTVPVFTNTRGQIVAFTLGVNTTQVFLHELRSIPNPQGYAGASYAVEVFVSSTIASAS